MILDKIDNIHLYNIDSISLKSALSNVQALETLPEENPYYRKLLHQFTTVSVHQKEAEFHKKYIDIHVVIEGEEYVKVGHIDNLVVTEPYSDIKDIGFGKLQQDLEYSGTLKPGYFLICFPEDAHLVGAHTDSSSEVTKLVYKIKVDAVKI